MEKFTIQTLHQRKNSAAYKIGKLEKLRTLHSLSEEEAAERGLLVGTLSQLFVLVGDSSKQ